MGPRRITAASAALALGLLLATAGVAAPSSGSHGAGRDHQQADGAGAGSWNSDSEPPPVTDPPVTEPPAPGHPSYGEHGSASGSSGGSTGPHGDGNPEQDPSSGGGVSTAGTPPAGVPQTLVTAPAAAVSDGPTTARELATPAGHSVAILIALVLAVLLFLSVHPRLDRSDPKLSAAQSGPDVARFR